MSLQLSVFTVPIDPKPKGIASERSQDFTRSNSYNTKTIKCCNKPPAVVHTEILFRHKFYVGPGLSPPPLSVQGLGLSMCVIVSRQNPSQGTRLSAESQTPEARDASHMFTPGQTESVSMAISTSGGPPIPTPLTSGSAASASGRTAPSTTTNTSASGSQRPTATASSSSRPPRPAPV